MRKAVRIAALVLVALAVVAIGIAFVASVLSERKRSRVIDVVVSPVAYAGGDAALARGKYLYQSRGCTECHGEDGAGRDVVNDPAAFTSSRPISAPVPAAS